MNEMCMRILEILDDREMTGPEIRRHVGEGKSIGYEMATLIGNGTVKVVGNTMDPRTNRRVAIYKKG